MDDLEAERRRYFRDRNERKLESEPPGLNLDMATFRRDFPDENPELVDNETDSKGLVVLCNAHRNDHEHEGRIAYMAVGLGVVVPVLLATAVNLYIIIRFTLDPRMVPRILIVDEWALGLLYAKIMLHAHQIQPPNRLTRGLTNVRCAQRS